MNKGFCVILQRILASLGGLTKVVILIAVLPFVCADAFAGIDKMPAPDNQMAAVRHGADLYTQYCMGCHSARLVTVGQLLSLGMSPDVLNSRGMDAGQETAALYSAMPAQTALQVFGLVPPDLSLMVQQKSSAFVAGSDWIYTYLRYFYQDTQSATGWNNALYPQTKMPHVLAELQGVNQAQFAPLTEAELTPRIVAMKQVETGKLSTVEYSHAVADLVSYLEWMAEPTQHQRKRLGVWVLLFLGVFAVLLWCLHAKYWKDVQ